MNKINNIENLSKSYQNKNNQNVSKKKIELKNSNNDEAIVAHTKPSLKAENVEDTATEVLEKAKTNASKALETSTANLDEARIKALLED